MKKAALLLITLLFLIKAVAALAADTVDINSASLVQLESITAVGPAIGQRIIDSRPYSSLDDLTKVKGIGEKTLEKIKSQGMACVGCQTTIADEALTTPAQNTTTTTQAPTATTNPAPTPTVATPKATYSSGVVVNELLPDPAGPDATDEWIELRNTNTATVDLSGWTLKDEQGTLTSYTFPQNSSLAANGFLVLKRPQTKIELNNASDGAQLLDPNGTIVDAVAYTNASLGQSYSKTETGWSWSTKPTPGGANIIAAVATKTNSKTLPAQKKSDTTEGVSLASSETADAAIPITENQDSTSGNSFLSNPWVFFWTVIGIAVLAGAAFLIKIIISRSNSASR
jgi:hypothetical protein